MENLLLSRLSEKLVAPNIFSIEKFAAGDLLSSYGKLFNILYLNNRLCLNSNIVI